MCAEGTESSIRTRARDVDSLKEWEKMVQRLSDNDAVEQITVYADMKAISSTCKIRRRDVDGGDSDDERSSDEEPQSVRLHTFYSMHDTTS